MERTFISKLMTIFYKTDIFIKYNFHNFVNIKNWKYKKLEANDD